MNIIVATGKDGEILFNNRRVSRDEYLIDDIASSFGEALVIKSRSAKLFAKVAGVKVVEDIFEDVSSDNWCFIEDADIDRALTVAKRIVIYNFNREYPFDIRLDIEGLTPRFRLTEKKSFVGHSHDKITKYVFVKNDD